MHSILESHYSPRNPERMNFQGRVNEREELVLEANRSSWGYYSNQLIEDGPVGVAVEVSDLQMGSMVRSFFGEREREGKKREKKKKKRTKVLALSPFLVETPTIQRRVSPGA